MALVQLRDGIDSEIPDGLSAGRDGELRHPGAGGR